jgi:hypothetical protein
MDEEDFKLLILPLRQRTFWDWRYEPTPEGFPALWCDYWLVIVALVPAEASLFVYCGQGGYFDPPAFAVPLENLDPVAFADRVRALVKG